jgi:hypothetical protein
MVRWRLGDQKFAKEHYDSGVEWMKSNAGKLADDADLNQELRRFRAEATALLGLEKAVETRKKTE